MVLGEMLCTLPSTHNCEADCTSPGDHLGNESRLVTISHAADNTSLFGFARKKGAL